MQTVPSVILRENKILYTCHMRKMDTKTLETGSWLSIFQINLALVWRIYAKKMVSVSFSFFKISNKHHLGGEYRGRGRGAAGLSRARGRRNPVNREGKVTVCVCCVVQSTTGLGTVLSIIEIGT